MTQTRFQFPRNTPEAQGIPSSAILALVDAAEQGVPEVHSLMVVRHGQVVAEGWWAPYTAPDPHMLFSLSKSFTSTAAGLAVAEGRLSLDDTVVSFFPDETPEEIGPNLAAMRVRHLLSMSTGHAEDSTGRLRDGDGGDWVRGFLALPVEHAPGTHFVYNSGATYMVSAIVQKVTGQPVLEFLRPRLFDPLGIVNPAWENSPQGINVGGWGLSITTEDIARFGQLYLQGGEWQGARLLPQAWVAEATAKQVSNGSDPESDWAQGYGFQFWRCRHNAYRGDGAFGQFCVVMPEQDAVVAITGGVRDLGAALNLVWDHLLSAMTPSPLPDDPETHERLRARLTALSLTFPAGQPASPIVPEVSGKTYVFPKSSSDEQGIESVRLDFGEDICVVTVRDARGEHRLEAGRGSWRRGTTSIGESGERPVAARGAWTTPDTYVLKACYYETPFSVTVTARFVEDRVQFGMAQNVSFGPTERPPLEGQAAGA